MEMLIIIRPCKVLVAILEILPVSNKEWKTIKRFYGGKSAKHDHFCALKTLCMQCVEHIVV